MTKPTMAPEFPLSPTLLERYRVAAARRMPAAMVGPHTRRRAGQSLEFQEYRHYVLGDDVRDVDWRASARLPRAEDLLVRRFVAEQQLLLVLSVDTRASMSHPAPMPKALIAGWLARALATIAGLAGDRVLVHALFADEAGAGDGSAALPVRGPEAGRRVEAFLKARIGAGADSGLDLGPLRPLLKPTAIWVVITDLYFDDPPPFPFASMLARVQDGYRWIVLVELDSWPMERAWLRGGPTVAEPPGPSTASGERRLDLGAEALRTTDARIAAHTQGLWLRARRGGLSHVHWRWPETEDIDPAAFFRDRFLRDAVLQRIFRRAR